MGLPQIQLQTGADGAIWRMCRLDLYRGEKVEEQDVPSRVGSRGARGVACTQAEARAQADRILYCMGIELYVFKYMCTYM